jgi:hypothetical protein
VELKGVDLTRADLSYALMPDGQRHP